MSKVQTIIDQLKDLTLLEASELVTAIEDTFNVSAAAPAAVAAAAPAAGGDVAAAEEKSEFDVVVKDVPADKKIAVIKVIKTALNIGLADAKTKVEAAPFKALEGAKKEDAEKLKEELVAAGASVTLE
jgi:large subunit ribosomal protein L7/L12